jgi:hypothetical protein
MASNLRRNNVFDHVEPKWRQILLVSCRVVWWDVVSCRVVWWDVVSWGVVSMYLYAQGDTLVRTSNGVRSWTSLISIADRA